VGVTDFGEVDHLAVELFRIFSAQLDLLCNMSVTRFYS
jgi:hypothetical protein